VAVCPNYLDYELAVLKSNIAACHLKLSQWKDAVSSATAAIDALDRFQGEATTSAEEAELLRRKKKAEDADVEDEIISPGAAKAAPTQLAVQGEEEEEAEAAQRKRREGDVARIKAKALMRRARARSELGGWSDLDSAEKDYRLLSVMSNLSVADRKIVKSQLQALPGRTKAAQEKETAEMLAKVKDVGVFFNLSQARRVMGLC
jgi:hypothetical protein